MDLASWRADDGGARPAGVSVRTLFTIIIVFDLLWGFLAAAVLMVAAALLGAPAGAEWAILLAGSAVGWVPLWLRRSIRFTADELVVTFAFSSHRIPWAQVEGVSFVDIHDHETDSVSRRRVTVRYRRHAAQPPPMPPGGYRKWSRAHFRTVSLPLFFPIPADGDGLGRAGEPRSWIGRKSKRKRDIIRRELAARGYPLPD